jgi:hypothetical protein
LADAGAEGLFLASASKAASRAWSSLFSDSLSLTRPFKVEMSSPALYSQRWASVTTSPGAVMALTATLPGSVLALWTLGFLSEDSRNTKPAQRARTATRMTANWA